MLDKITFLEYTGLPGIIAERLFTMILYRQYVQPLPGHHDTGVSSPCNQSNNFEAISVERFIEGLLLIFLGEFK
jgi:hypothetical protein